MLNRAGPKSSLSDPGGRMACRLSFLGTQTGPWVFLSQRANLGPRFVRGMGANTNFVLPWGSCAAGNGLLKPSPKFRLCAETTEQ